MKGRLIDADTAVMAIDGLRHHAADVSKEELLDMAIYEVLSMKTMVPETEHAPEARWIMRRNEGQGVSWHECSNCTTVGSPRWKRCPVCEAKMNLLNAGG